MVLVCWGLVPLLLPPLETVVQLSVPVLGAALAAAAYEIPPAGLGGWGFGFGFFLPMSGGAKLFSLGSFCLGGGGGGGGGGAGGAPGASG